jgi:hypothetical protein
MTYFAFNSQKRAVLPPDPVTLDDFKVEDEWATTGGPTPQPFLIHDSGAGHADRVIVFSSTEQLRHLAVADTWFMDGTFTVAPRLFSQVYVIRAPLADSAVTCAYAFLTGYNHACKIVTMTYLKLQIYFRGKIFLAQCALLVRLLAT